MCNDLENTYQKALDAAAKQLSYRALSAHALRDKLIGKGYPEDAADYALAWLEERGLLSDTAYADSVVRSYERRGYGKMRIRQELARRGIGREVSEDALEEHVPDLEKMLALLDKRLHGDCSDRREIEKAVAALQRRGFSWEEIRTALKAYQEGDDE